MKNLKALLLTLLLALAVPLGVWGQTALRATTLAEVVDDTETSIDITSATGVTVDDIAFVDKEAMLVISVDTTNNRITVQRGYSGTVADDHANSAVIYIDDPDRFISKDLAGACTAGSEFPNYAPLINVRNAKFYECIASVWREVVQGTRYKVVEGATANAFETFLDVTEPTADRTVTLPDQTGNFLLFANANTQDVNIIFEGATADANEITLTVADVAADRTVTFADATGTVFLSTLATNAPDIASSVWGVSNGLVFEGATADAFEITVAPADAGADATVTVPATTGEVVIALADVITLTNVDLDLADNTIAANVCEDHIQTVAGIAATDNIIATMTTSDLSVVFSVTFHTPGAGVITTRACNNSAGAVDPGAVADFRLIRIASP